MKDKTVIKRTISHCGKLLAVYCRCNKGVLGSELNIGFRYEYIPVFSDTCPDCGFYEWAILPEGCEKFPTSLKNRSTYVKEAK